MMPPPTIPAPLAPIPGDWSPVRNYTHWRVFRVVRTQTTKQVGAETLTEHHARGEYHHGSDGHVRVYDGFNAAQVRANKLNGGPVE
jgi:hypothetical protein